MEIHPFGDGLYLADERHNLCFRGVSRNGGRRQLENCCPKIKRSKWMRTQYLIVETAPRNAGLCYINKCSFHVKPSGPRGHHEALKWVRGPRFPKLETCILRLYFRTKPAFLFWKVPIFFFFPIGIFGLFPVGRLIVVRQRYSDTGG